MKRVCSICGKEFETNSNSHKYCSKECQRQGHLLKRREYYQIHKEQINAYSKQYYQAHREECKAYNKQYRQKHREECKAYNKQYRQKHREEIIAYKRMMYKTNNPEIAKCCSTHNNCFSCPTLDGECLYD